MTFYSEVFGGTLSLSTYEDFDGNDGAPNAIAHGVLSGVVSLVGSAASASQSTVRLEGFMLSSVDGLVVDPLALKPWGASNGQVIDRHGLHWLIGYEPAP